MSDLPAFIGRYRVVEQLGRGGMGVVYLARDPAIDRTVALKVARVDSVELRQRFLREARATGRLRHRNIVTIFDVGEHDGEPFIAMEYVPGRTLAEVVRRREPLPILARLRLLRELCDGLACAHAAGVVHRDVKPANLMVHEDSGALTILDFGIARLGNALTASGIMIGTPNYMAPEQIDGRDVDHRCDIFAVGLVGYELLSYRRAFSGENSTAVIYSILHDDPAPLAELVPDLDGGLVEIIARATVKSAAGRYQHLSELVPDLDAAIARIDQAGDDPTSTILLPSENGAPTPSGGSGLDRGALIERRNTRLAAHLAAAAAALDDGRCDDAQREVEHAALIDPDNESVLRMMERLDAAQRARQVDEHLSNARAHLREQALTKAAESVGLVLKLQPECAPALELRRDIERRRSINERIEAAERHVAEGEFGDAVAAADEVLAIDPSHEAARRVKSRAEQGARDRRAQAAADEARRKCAAGDFVAAQELLERFDGPHDLVATELDRVRAAIRKARESYDTTRRRPASAGSPAPASLPADTTTPVPRSEAPSDPTRSTRSSVGIMLALAAVAAAVIWFVTALGDGSDRGGDGTANVPAPLPEAASVAPEPESARAPIGPVAAEEPPVPAGTGAPGDPSPGPPGPADEPPRAVSPSPPAPSPPASPDGPHVGRLLADAVAAETAGNPDDALTLYGRALGLDADNPIALAGRRRTQASIDRRAAREVLRRGDDAFAEGRFGDARRLFQEAFDLDPSPEASAGLQRAGNAAALACAGEACGTLVVRVTPAAEIFIDDRALGTAAGLDMRLSAGRHRVRLETDEWRYPRVLEIATGVPTVIDVDLMEDGFPR